MWSEDFWGSGMWIFPFMMMLIMLFVVSRMFGRGGGFRPPWNQDSDRSPSESAGPSGTSGQAPESPLEILKTRYAKGEITKEEYDQMKSDL